jgi:hypothetical protein
MTKLGLEIVNVDRKQLDKFKQDSKDAKWLMANYDHYRSQHGGEYVAVQKEQVIDHDKDLMKLKKRVKEKSAFIQFIYKEKPELIL